MWEARGDGTHHCLVTVCQWSCEVKVGRSEQVGVEDVNSQAALRQEVALERSSLWISPLPQRRRPENLVEVDLVPARVVQVEGEDFLPRMDCSAAASDPEEPWRPGSVACRC